MKVVFVCLGNICRSPMAEAVFRQMVKDKGLEQVLGNKAILFTLVLENN